MVSVCLYDLWYFYVWNECFGFLTTLGSWDSVKWRGTKPLCWREPTNPPFNIKHTEWFFLTVRPNFSVPKWKTIGSHFSQLCLKAKQILLGGAQRNVYFRCSMLKGKLLQGICRMPRRGTAGGQISQNRPFVQSCSIHFSFSFSFFSIFKLRRHSQESIFQSAASFFRFSHKPCNI